MWGHYTRRQARAQLISVDFRESSYPRAIHSIYTGRGDPSPPFFRDVHTYNGQL